MGKNKANSADDLLDLIFQVKEWRKLRQALEKQGRTRKEWKDVQGSEF